MDILRAWVIVLILFVTQFMSGCDSKINCPTSEQCKRYGTCINDGPNRCITGCEKLCKAEGLCSPDRSDGTLNCVAKFDDCLEAKVCRKYGRCSAVNGYCIPTSDEQCQASMECGISGNCKVINNECMPTSDMDCVWSWGCKFDNRCFFNPGRRSFCGHSRYR